MLACLGAAPARAGLVEDCTQTEDWWLRVRACTAAIEDTRWPGRRGAWAWSNRAVAHAELGNYIAAFDDHRQAVTLDPADARARNSKANAHAAFREYDRALADYDRAIALDPGFLAALLNRADLYLTIGDFTAAIADFSRVIAEDAAYGPAFAGRAAARCGAGDTAGSLEDRYRALDLGTPGEAEVTDYLATKGYRAPPFDEALAAWTRAGCP